MILTVIPFDKYNLFCDCDFVNSLENKKYINRKKGLSFQVLAMIYVVLVVFSPYKRLLTFLSSSVHFVLKFIGKPVVTARIPTKNRGNKVHHGKV